MLTSRSIRVLRSLVAVALTLGAAGFGQGDPSARPEIAEEFLDRMRRLEGDAIRFCVYDRAVTKALDVAVAQAIGDALLIRSEVVEVSTPIAVEGIDFFPFSEDELYIFLTNDCRAFLGFTLAANVYPAWLTFSRPYAATSFVAVAREGALPSLDALDAGGIVGTTMLSEGDVALTAWLGTLPETERWRRFPYPHVPILLERLLDGTVDAALVWEPALAAFGDPSALAVVPSDPLRLPTRQLAIALRVEDAFVRTAIDEALGALIAEGFLDDLYETLGVPATQP